MIKWLGSRVLWGSLLIIGGILFLLQNLGWINSASLFWAILLGLGGVFFFTIFFASRRNWWALVPGMALFSTGLVIILDYFVAGFPGNLGGSVILVGTGLSFGLIFLIDRQQWWAIIPGGVLISLAVALGLNNTPPEIDSGGIFMMGLGTTFALVALVPTRNGRLWWAWIPAGTLFLIGLLLTAITGTLLPYLIPLALIIGGGLLIFFTLRRKNS